MNMATEHGHGAPPLNNPEVSYEHSDLSAKGILIFFIGLATAALLIHVLLAGMFVAGKMLSARFLDQEPNPMVSSQQLPPAPPLQNAGPQSVSTFPEPRLQVDDTADMSKLLLAQEQQLNPAHPYRTPDGTVHISIDDAMRLIAERGLPVAPQGQASASSSRSNATQNSTQGGTQPR